MSYSADWSLSLSGDELITGQISALSLDLMLDLNVIDCVAAEAALTYSMLPLTFDCLL